MGRQQQFTDDQILEVARACFLEHGPSVSTNVIADKLGVSQAALFKRFGTKEELLLAAILPDETMPWVKQVSAGPDPERDLREQLIEIGGIIDEYLSSLVPRMAVLRSAGFTPEGLCGRYAVPPPVQGHRAMSKWFGHAIKLGMIEAEDPGILALTFLGAFHLRHFVHHTFGEALVKSSSRHFIKNLVDTVCRGIETKESAS